jgi:DNA-binding response OmpR family regulator
MNQHDALSINGRPTVLIAEDDPDQSDMLRDVLEEEGYHVDTAFSGDTALRKLFHHDYCVILLDIRMPGLDGITVLQRYRKEKIGAQAAVVIVSAFATDAELGTYRKAGANAAYAKPYDLNQLLATIAELVSVKEGPRS